LFDPLVDFDVPENVGWAPLFADTMPMLTVPKCKAGQHRIVAAGVRAVLVAGRIGRKVRLFRGRRIAQIRVGAGVKAALPVRGKLRDGDGRQDADDRHDHQQFDQRETLVFQCLHLSS
jgi:hypothetical protein